MALKSFSFKKLVLFFLSRILLLHFRSPKGLQKAFSNAHKPIQFRVDNRRQISQSNEALDQTLIFNVEGALLRSSSLFSYFMLVAFEAGSLIRGLVLLILYPFISLVSEEMGLKVMVMICFFGLKKESFRAGRAVLPKFFMEDVGLEAFLVLMRAKKRVGVTDLPLVMVDSFLRDYLEMDVVIGRDLKVFHGYFVGLMEGRRSKNIFDVGEMITKDYKDNDMKGNTNSNGNGCVIGFSSFNKSRLDHHPWLSQCEEIYLVSEKDKAKWHQLPKNRYPKPVIFHDGRLVCRPTPLTALTMLMWFPFSLILVIARSFMALLLPYNMAIPLLAFTGMHLKLIQPRNHCPLISKSATKGRLYVCNHRTLLDPLFVSYGLKKPLTAVTYSISKVSEILSPIRTVRLTRDRDEDARMMEKLLSEGDLVVCPEGTTCREPFLLRFSPLFSEVSEDIVPVAMDAHVSMFYGTTASGFKCMDPLFFLANPSPAYTLQFLQPLPPASAVPQSRFDMANSIQNHLAKALGFTCTRFTRKDKYLILAGNQGIVTSGK